MNTFVEKRLKIVHKVLVVDDEMVNRRILGKILSDEFGVVYAENGRQALELLQSNRELISLVLLDLLMPEMDGYELLGILREDADLKRIPVIVLTSERSAEVNSLQLGAVDFIPKPYDMPEVILARVRRSIELSEDRDLIGAIQYDSLTGLYNREFFMEYTQLHDQYYPDVETDAIVLNINRFHLLNEMHGRSFGDRVLCRLADGLREIAHREHGIAARSGADAFYLYLPHGDAPEKLLEEVASSVRDMIDTGRLRMGIYPRADRSLEPEHRFDCALLACNSIRNNFNSQITCYDAEMHEKETYSERLINGIDEALAEKQFVVYYQPKFNIKGDKPVLSSAEALIRWQHPELGMVRPGKFIPLFESNGLVQKLDHYVWREVAAQIRRWREQYGITVPVSVNVSRIDLMEPDFVTKMQRIVEEQDLEPQDYYLEVTESAYTETSDQIVDIVNTLRELGFRVEMDDFGSGYSSLNMLSNLPIDVLKLDMKFIRNIHRSPRDLRMVELIMDIARFLDVVVVAEGVEVEEQYRLLKQAGCDVIQGYYFSRPLPPKEFAAFVEEKAGAMNSAEPS